MPSWSKAIVYPKPVVTTKQVNGRLHGAKWFEKPKPQKGPKEIKRI